VIPQLLIAVGLAAAAAVVAAVLRHRQPMPAPTQPVWQAPAQLDRADFAQPDAPYLVAVFTSATCRSCSDMAEKAAVLASSQVAVDVVEVTQRPDVHRKYAVDAVPMVVVADRHGVVGASFIGPASATDLWAAVAEVREPGSSPEPGLGRG
jgi:Thioredoxin domain